MAVVSARRQALGALPIIGCCVLCAEAAELAAAARKNNPNAINTLPLDYIDETLPVKTRNKFEAHLKRCPNCAPFFQQYKSTIELVREDRDIRIPDYLVEHTLAFLRQNIGSA